MTEAGKDEALYIAVKWRIPGDPAEYGLPAMVTDKGFGSGLLGAIDLAKSEGGEQARVTDIRVSTEDHRPIWTAKIDWHDAAGKEG